MNAINAPDFNLQATLESGQIFRYHNSTNGFYYIVVGDSIIKLLQKGDKLHYDCISSEFDVRNFLGLNHSYGKIIKSISRDEKISAAIKKHHGLRILEQDLWECTASFICSSFSNIPRIRQCIEKIAATFGSSIEFDSFKSFSFPQPRQINNYSKLKKCGLGYRAKYLFETAKIFSSRGNEYSQQHNSAVSGMCNRTMSDLQLRKLSYADAKEKLLELPGVGSKVADCILLFSCGFYGAFPVDVWIQRVMAASYSSGLSSFAAAAGKKSGRITQPVVAEFGRSYFGEYAGYAQQFLYHSARAQKKPIIYLTN